MKNHPRINAHSQERSRGPAARRSVLAAGTAALALVLAACGGGSNPLQEGTPASEGSAGGSLVIGSSGGTESQIIAELYAGALTAAGYDVTTKPGIGSREVYVKAVEEGSVDIIPDYSGNLLLFLDAERYGRLREGRHGGTAGRAARGPRRAGAGIGGEQGRHGGTKATAEKHKLTSIEDMAPVCGDLVIGANPEFAEREYGLPGLKANYNCVPKSFEPINDYGGPTTLNALITDKIQVADIYTTTPSIEDNDLVVLEDPKNNFIAQQVLPLVRTESVDDKASKVLNEVSCGIDHRGPD